MAPSPTPGRIVQYRVSADDADMINRRREDYATSAKSIRTGFIAHAGNRVAEGQIFPALIVRVWDDAANGVNLKVFLDGNDDLWATSRKEGDDVGTWHWPERT